MLEVRFLNLVSGSSTVRSRVFESEATYAQWAASVHGLIEIVEVRAVVAS